MKILEPMHSGCFKILFHDFFQDFSKLCAFINFVMGQLKKTTAFLQGIWIIHRYVDLGIMHILFPIFLVIIH